MIPNAYFGSPNDKPVDWAQADDEVDPDDEELAQTSPEVVEILGFDPLELNEEEKK